MSSRNRFVVSVSVCLLSLSLAEPLAAQDGERRGRAQPRQPKAHADEPVRRGSEPELGERDQSYSPTVLERPLAETMKEEAAQRDQVLAEQQQLLEQRYDLRDDPSGVMMSGGRRAVQQGVRVKLPEGISWDQLSQMSPDEIRQQDLFPMGFRPLPHVKHPTGGMVFPDMQIEEIRKAEQRELERFDVAFDLPEHLLPEFPPPLFLTNHPELGDVTQGQVLTTRNFHELLEGKMTPFQLEGMRLLLSQFPQQQFNATEDRKVEHAQQGVACLDCHVNGHTNATFHLNPDTRPQRNRFRIDTVSLRGMFQQQIHGSKRALRSVEDFTEFEQRTAYFDGDQVMAAKKGLNSLDRGVAVAAMAQAQIMFDFPPAPKLDAFGKLDSSLATEQELLGQEVFFGKGRCGECHPAPHYLDNLMRELPAQRFYEPQMVRGHLDIDPGPMKTFTLRGIKDSPPYLHDGRLLTLDDTAEYFNLVLQLDLTQEEKDALVAFMRCL